MTGVWVYFSVQYFIFPLKYLFNISTWILSKKEKKKENAVETCKVMPEKIIGYI